jgi:hypothetical protein
VIATLRYSAGGSYRVFRNGQLSALSMPAALIIVCLLSRTCNAIPQLGNSASHGSPRTVSSV